LRIIYQREISLKENSIIGLGRRKFAMKLLSISHRDIRYARSNVGASVISLHD